MTWAVLVALAGGAIMGSAAAFLSVPLVAYTAPPRVALQRAAMIGLMTGLVWAAILFSIGAIIVSAV